MRIIHANHVFHRRVRARAMSDGLSARSFSVQARQAACSTQSLTVCGTVPSRKDADEASSHNGIPSLASKQGHRRSVWDIMDLFVVVMSSVYIINR